MDITKVGIENPMVAPVVVVMIVAVITILAVVT
jgi:hypothetical protein